MDYTIWSVGLIFLLPFMAFVVNTVIVKRFTTLAVGISCSAIFGSFLLSLRIFSDFQNKFAADYHIHKVFNWMNLSGGDQTFVVDMGVYIDNMGSIMLLMVTGVAFLIHIFSTFYMRDDARYGRFFVYLSLFTSAMLGLVLSDNLLSFFIFWELMGFCSYSLIGFYYEKNEAGDASIKAFMTTRIGDVFFLLGILAIWSVVGNVTFVDIYRFIGENGFVGKTADLSFFGTVIGIPLATFAGLAIFMGTIGKSAQFPLQVWLPDAMMGPTPCSALIHAATMVAAGVYLSLRMYPLMEAGNLNYFIAIIGGITAFGAATIALIQTDIKAVLAYSTISQLGYMVLGIGVGSYTAAFMHLITHAVFKACLFLSAGSVIHSLHDHHTHEHVQEMPRMGGLRKKMPFTFWAMMFCTLAITGAPFFSGFVSKDRILGDAAVQLVNGWKWYIPAILGYGGAFLTAFYMFRMMFLTFFGEPRDKELYDHMHTEHFSWNQNLPLLVLSVFTFGAWYCGSFTGQSIAKVPGVQNKEWFSTLVTKPDVNNFTHYQKQPWEKVDKKSDLVFEKSHYDASHGLEEKEAHRVHHVHVIGAIVSVFIFLGGLLMAMMMYYWKKWNPGRWTSAFSFWYRALQNKYYMDDLYIKIIIQKGLLNLNNFLAFLDMGIYDRYAVDGMAKVNSWAFKVCRWFDDVIVDTVVVDGTGASVRIFNVVLRTFQSGKIQFYIFMILFVMVGYIWQLNI
ncbi:MAG: NADH-quinone oxidoreductase subunit L [Halobacteriovoraceae bacterium]|jgi:NADH-quinone oxidoreductase subunit L|nr:NADH-quinone oxidoreductase subunit L [Halobacteriovoraceae bacterium]